MRRMYKINKLFKDYRFNLFIFILFTCFAVIDSANNAHFMLLVDILVMISEATNFKQNYKIHKKEKMGERNA